MAVLYRRQAMALRAVDDEGEVPDLLLQRQREDRGRELMRKLLKKHGCAPDVLMTDKLRSYTVATSELRLTARHEQALRRNSREFPPPGSSTRAEDAAVQIARINATVPVRSCRDPERVQRPPPSRFPQYAPRSQGRSVSELRGGACDGLTKRRALRLSFGGNQVYATTAGGGYLAP
jgi:hypothetical protein